MNVIKTKKNLQKCTDTVLLWRTHFVIKVVLCDSMLYPPYLHLGIIKIDAQQFGRGRRLKTKGFQDIIIMRTSLNCMHRNLM